jgi:acyl-coenzyme A synthetase/AMP-(fatty) acid ligase
VKELERFLKRRLPAYKTPATYEVRDDLPKNESGKIMKARLQAQN